MAGKIDIKNVVAKRSGSNGTAPKISLPSGVPTDVLKLFDCPGFSR